MSKVDGVGGGQQVVAESVKNVLGKDDFLKLLITQLKYQDPLEPTDNKDFIAQMAQFSSLEQMTNMSKGFEAMAAMQESILRESAVAQAVNLIGRSVTALLPAADESGSPTKVTGTVTGMKIVDGAPSIVVNGKEIPLGYIEEVSQIPRETPAQGGA